MRNSILIRPKRARVDSVHNIGARPSKLPFDGPDCANVLVKKARAGYCDPLVTRTLGRAWSSLGTGCRACCAEDEIASANRISASWSRPEKGYITLHRVYDTVCRIHDT